MGSLPLKASVVASLPKEDCHILVAVSGGVDSVVLLHVLHSLTADCGISLSVAHLDHQIRRESSADADFVRQLSRRWGLSCYIEACDVPLLAKEQHLSLEMAGRQVRRSFLQQLAGDLDADLIALAHHQDDQVETFLLRLLRGSGLSGLAAMRVLSGIWWRPLLECRRVDILQYAEAHQLTWVEDESNCDHRFLRNRLRTQIIPQLAEINPVFSSSVGRLTRQCQVEEDYWRFEVERHFDSLVISTDDGIRLDRSSLLQCHQALRLRLLREGLHRVRGDLQAIETIHLGAVEGLLYAARSQAQLDLPGCWVARRYDVLWIRQKAPVVAEPFDLSLIPGGEVALPDGRVIRTTIGDELEGESLGVAEFSLTELLPPLRIRSWQPGDQFEPLGMSGHKRLKRFFADNKVELEVRSTTPLLVAGETILWIVGMRRSRHATARHDAGSTLRVELLN